MNKIFIMFPCVLFFTQAVFAYNTNVQEDFIITDFDIKSAIPTPKEVVLNKKTTHALEVMEQRHFGKINDYDSPKYRVAKLEEYLLKRTWEYSNTEDRIERLKLASQRKLTSGTSLPPAIRKNFSPQRIANDSTPVYEDDDNVGIIDGLLKLYAPDIYYSWSDRKKRLNERYNDG